MIIGTAGHIDHGKSTLVKALSGVDPDRLAEEQARGITLDLGYAYADLEGARIGFVDVPGHERLVRNMLAGATGIDHVLLVVAADDGPMPQTREHLAIVELLGLTQATVAITKIDRVEPARVEQVCDEVRALLASGPLAGAPLFPVAAAAGADGPGMAALSHHLAEVARGESTRRSDGLFRLAVDRAFTLPGAGLIVTGTAHSGVVAVGDELVVGPAGVPARVRRIHALNAPAERGHAGQRCSLGLATALQKDDLRRGCWLMSPALYRPTQRIDVELRLLASEARALRHWTPVHCHLGADDIPAHVAILNDDERLEPGAQGHAQIVLDRPTHAVHGDRLILRDQSAQRTIAGGRVLDIDPPVRRRRSAERLAMLDALALPDTERRFAGLLRLGAQGATRDALIAAWNPGEAQLDALVQRAGARRVAVKDHEHLFDPQWWQARKATLLQALADFHAEHQDEAGIDRDRLRRIAVPALERAVYLALIAEMLADGELIASGPWLALPSHRVQLSPREELFRQKVLPQIEQARFDPPWMRDIARAMKIDERSARMYLRRLARAGFVAEVVPDLFFARPALESLAAVACRQAADDGVIETSAYRDRVGLGRKRAIQILEYFDRVGLTRRVGDRRFIRPDSSLAAAAGGAKETSIA